MILNREINRGCRRVEGFGETLFLLDGSNKTWEVFSYIVNYYTKSDVQY